ncbi:MAG: hypothetical protein KAJ42_00175 [Gemmatimonadetes bacterium]|nr:hypothetical protein [Gemmatimonadota bacterium]
MNENVQQMIARARTEQMPVSVGANGPMAASAAMAGLGQGGFPAGVQGCAPAPAVPPPLLQQDCSVYQECFVPLGIAFGVDQAGNIYSDTLIGQAPNPALGAPGYQLFPRNGNFWIFGVRFFTDVNFVVIESVITGDSDWNHLLGPVDPATWNVDECFCPVNWGCISITNPLRITARSIDTIATTILPVRGTAWGIRRASVGTCGPLTEPVVCR